MKNRNTKDAGENHIYPFILSNLFLFIGIFFSLNSAPEVAILFYSLALNLFTHWLKFYKSVKKKIAHYSEYYNNLIIGVLCGAALVPVFIMLFLLLLNSGINIRILLLCSWILSFIAKFLLTSYFNWESKAEELINRYRMSIGNERDVNFETLKAFIDLNRKKFAGYIYKSQLFDDKIEEHLKNQ